ncbi:hypothetical protein OROMI_029293 [Orobanche minor]
MMAIPIPSRQLFIDGEWREPVQKNRIPIINPATEDTIGIFQQLLVKMLKFLWRLLKRHLCEMGVKIGPMQLGHKYLRAIAAKITEKKWDLAKLEAIDCGKPLEEAA